jgi:putative ABC transport system permease protein
MSSLGAGHSLRCVMGWAWRDVLFEWRISLCLSLAVAAVLAPLLVLFGLKSGIVDTLTTRLKTDPRNREIVWKLNNPLEKAWIAEFARRPEIGFLVPSTRSLAATVDLMAPNDASLPDTDMLPTAPGDPLWRQGQAVPKGLGEIALSHEAARRLGIETGASVQGRVVRAYRGQRQTLDLTLRVVAVLAEPAFSGKVVFVALPLLEALEAYRDGYSAPELGALDGAAGPAPREHYSRLRLYARTLDDVAPLADALRAAGFDVATRSKDIELVKQIDHALSFLFRLLAGIGVTGGLLSLGASLWANVERKRRDLALLRLIGVRERILAAFPATQAVTIATAGLALSFASYAAAALLINQTFQTDLGREEFVCRLAFGDGLLTILLTELLAVIAALMGVSDVIAIDPAESLREL